MSKIVLLNGNAFHIPLADSSVHCVITSPPYFGLRDYGLTTWGGGDAECDHRESNNANKGNTTESHAGRFPICPKCGAIRHDAGIGLEATADCGRQNLMRLRSDLTEDQIAYVVQRLQVEVDFGV